jgi:hypothetical protein
VVDREPVNLPDTVAYKSMMLSGVPNFVYAIGYTNASWTLKVDLVCEYFCRLIAHGADAFVPEITDPDMKLQPLLDFQAGYVLRALDRFPKRGEVEPWFLAQDYFKDRHELRTGDVADGTMRFFDARVPARDDLALAA